MGMWSFCLYGKNSKEEIPIGYGPRLMVHWSLPFFPGPTVWANFLGHPERKLVFLPPDLLELLYSRFGAANPDGIVIGELGELEARFSPEGKTALEIEGLYEARKLFVSLTLTDEEQGYPHLRRYLPEVFDQPRLLEMVADPWLDVQLLDAVAPTLPLGDEAGGEADAHGYRPVSPQGRSERWWPQWRTYCDELERKRSVNRAPLTR